MTIYTVLAPPAGADSAGPDPERFLFVKEGFCWPAFFVAPIWFVWRRMWLVLLLYLVAAIAVFWLVGEMALPLSWLTTMLFAFLVALEANNLRRWTLERRGYRLVGIASGDNRGEAELRFFAGFTATENREPESPPPTRPAVATPTEAGEVVGLFPRPGGA